jgi:hypothetical protein
MAARRSAHRVLAGRFEGRRPLGISWHRWKGDIKMDLQEVGWGVMDWIAQAQDRDRWQSVVKVIMNLSCPQNAGTCSLAEDLLASQEGLGFKEFSYYPV